MAECLICKKETENENQICDECAKVAEEHAEEKQVEETPKMDAPKSNKKAGLIGMILGICAIVFFFLQGTIITCFRIIPILGPWVIAPLLSTFAPIILLALSIIAIVLGSKSKNTESQGMGKVGKALGIVVLVLMPIKFIINLVWNIVLWCILIGLILLLVAPSLLLQILSFIIANPEVYEFIEEFLEEFII